MATDNWRLRSFCPVTGRNSRVGGRNSKLILARAAIQFIM